VGLGFPLGDGVAPAAPAPGPLGTGLLGTVAGVVGPEPGAGGAE